MTQVIDKKCKSIANMKQPTDTKQKNIHIQITEEKNIALEGSTVLLVMRDAAKVEGKKLEVRAGKEL